MLEVALDHARLVASRSIATSTGLVALARDLLQLLVLERVAVLTPISMTSMVVLTHFVTTVAFLIVICYRDL